MPYLPRFTGRPIFNWIGALCLLAFNGLGLISSFASGKEDVDSCRKIMAKLLATPDHSYEEVLGASSTTQVEEAKKVFRSLMKKFHPDQSVLKGIVDDKLLEASVNKIKLAWLAFEKAKSSSETAAHSGVRDFFSRSNPVFSDWDPILPVSSSTKSSEIIRESRAQDIVLWGYNLLGESAFLKGEHLVYALKRPAKKRLKFSVDELFVNARPDIFAEVEFVGKRQVKILRKMFDGLSSKIEANIRDLYHLKKSSRSFSQWQNSQIKDQGQAIFRSFGTRPVNEIEDAQLLLYDCFSIRWFPRLPGRVAGILMQSAGTEADGARLAIFLLSRAKTLDDFVDIAGDLPIDVLETAIKESMSELATRPFSVVFIALKSLERSSGWSTEMQRQALELSLLMAQKRNSPK